MRWKALQGWFKEARMVSLFVYFVRRIRTGRGKRRHKHRNDFLAAMINAMENFDF